MRDGFKVWDTDTHIRPSHEALEPFYDAAMRSKLEGLQHYRRFNKRDDEGLVPGSSSYSFPGGISYPRMLGQASSAGAVQQPKHYQGSKHPRIRPRWETMSCASGSCVPTTAS